MAEQVAADLERRRKCPHCGKRHASKAQGSIKVKTVFGRVEVPNPRWHRCSCQSTGPGTFRPAMTSWLAGQTSPELLYLETKWASLIPYAKVAELLKDVLPVADTFESRDRAQSSSRHCEPNRAKTGRRSSSSLRRVGSGLGRAAVARRPDDRWN